MAASNPHRELMELLVQWAAWPAPARSRSLEVAVRLLADERIAWNVRRQAAARLLRLVPDRRRYVRPLVRALTRGLPRRQVWECLRWLQEEVPRCEALDRWVARWERRRRWRCPRCPLRLPLADFARHLWSDHGLIFDAAHRRVRSPRQLLLDLWKRWRQTRNPQWLDHAWFWGGEAALREWLRHTSVSLEDLRPLLQQAAQEHCGLCPACLAQVPASAPPQWPPLTLTPRRLSTFGWSVDYQPGPWWEIVTIQTPRRRSLVRFRPASRLWACLAALTAAGLLLIVLPPSSAMVVLPVVCALLYGLVRYLLRSAVPPEDLLIDAAWQYLVPELAWQQPEHCRLLIRLCQTSLGKGDPAKRRAVLQHILHHLQDQSVEGKSEWWHLRGVAQWLEWCDALPAGIDRSMLLVSLLSPAFRGEVPWTYAEAVAAAYLAQPVEYGSLLRVQVLLCQEAFSSGWTPADLQLLCLALPALNQVLTPSGPQQWQYLYGLFQMKFIPAWSSGIVNVFECAQRWPHLTGRWLAAFPDLLWVERWDPAHEAVLGPILITARGVSLAGYFSLNPEADIRLMAHGYGLVFDDQVVYTSRPLPADLPQRLRDWLRVLDDFLRHLPAVFPTASEGPRHLLAAAARSCRHCRTSAIISPGGIGRRLASAP